MSDDLWPKHGVVKHFNLIALCRRCGIDATQTKFTHYVSQCIQKGPYHCDDCLLERSHDRA